MATKVKKISVSIPESVVEDLDAIANYMSISRSAIITLLLKRSTGPLRVFAKQVSLIEESDPLTRSRLVEGVMKQMNDQLTQLKRGLNDKVQ